MKQISRIIIAASVLASGTTMAADKETVLTSMEGQVMVNQGQAYVDATQSMLLYPGDRLMVMQGGSAQLQFANGCVQDLHANEIATVGTAESCSTAQAAGTYHQVGGPPTTKPAGGSASATAATAVNKGGLVIAAAAGAGLAYGIDQHGRGNNNDPGDASP